MSKPLLIHTEASRGWGGQEMRTLAEAGWFRSQGYDVELICPADSRIAPAAAEQGLVVHHRELKKGTQLQDFWFCYQLFRERTPQMVGTHSNIDSRVALGAAAWAKVPHRFRYRHVSIPVRKSPWNSLIYKKWATSVITTAEMIAEPLRRDFDLDKSRVRTIATGVKAPEFLIDQDKARLLLCEELSLPTTARFLGQVSVLRAWKGHADVMKAFDQVSREFPDYHLVFVGGGHGIDYLPPQAEALDCGKKIHFIGHQTDPWPYLRAFDIATLASTAGEGIPQSGMQAMLAECAFIGTTVGGIPEIVQAGENGLLVSPEAPEELAKAIRSLLANPDKRLELIEKARSWATTHTTLDRMGQAVLEMMDSSH